MATVTGWGSTEPLVIKERPETYSGVLKEITIPIAGDKQCSRKTAYHYSPETMLCAGLPKQDASPCFGDGGSPLVRQEPKSSRWVLVGLFSWSEGCGQWGKFSYYTRVSKFKKWINKMTSDS